MVRVGTPTKVKIEVRSSFSWRVGSLSLWNSASISHNPNGRVPPLLRVLQRLGKTQSPPRPARGRPWIPLRWGVGAARVAAKRWKSAGKELSEAGDFAHHIGQA